MGSFADVIHSTRQASKTASITFQALESQSSVLSDQMSEISTAISEITIGMAHIVSAVDKLLHTSSDVNGKMEHMSESIIPDQMARILYIHFSSLITILTLKKAFTGLYR